MKKIIAFVLALLTIVPFLVSCESGPHQADEDKGAVITMYMTDEMYNFDPALTYTDDSALKVISLLYEGLMKVNDSGKVEKALADEIIYNKEKNIMQIKLKSTKWSDGRDVTADDFVFAWKRILEPDFDSPASSMLLDIKNARAVKRGDMTIDDLGLAAVESFVLEIEFEGEINEEEFIENLASPALVPLREDVVARKQTTWSKRATEIKTNGQFLIRKLVYGDYMVIERSSYYYRDVENDEVLTKYVTPYRFYIQFYMDRDENMAAYENNELYYMGEIPLAKRAEYKDKATVTDLMSNHTYYFNNNNKLFSNKLVRQALSAAIDRQAIADMVVFAKPATGYITPGVLETNKSNDFRKKGGDLISTTADLSKAQSLLKEAGVSSGSFSISVRETDETAVAIAEYCAGVWQQLGFKVTVKKLGKTRLENFEDESDNIYRYSDDLDTAFAAGDFDIIAIDDQMISTDAFANLAPFAKEFSGRALDLANQNYDPVAHITGFDNEEYNTIIADAFAAKDTATRVAKLHEAEALLMDEMPVMPIVFNQSAYLSSNLLSGIKTSWYGIPVFTRMSMKDYNSYLPETTEEVVTTAAN